MDQNNNKQELTVEAVSRLNALKSRYDSDLKELDEREFTSIVAGGQIKLKMLGNLSVKTIFIDPDYMLGHGTKELGDAIALAFNNCRYDIKNARDQINNQFSTDSMNLLREMQLKGVNFNNPLGGGNN